MNTHTRRPAGPCPGPAAVGAVVVEERIAVLDAQIARLTRPRDALKARRGQGG
ncbi:hypothetical protein [Streptomyces sp. NPDC001508]|uniref:hypothetical protein n=1 Tax=Streptomyces sp. NPDC001508 TaxID=3154656 RepID=UPI003327FC94